MKFNLFSNQNSLKVVVLALAGFAMATPKAHAVTAQLGDLIFGVRDISTTAPINNVYLFDLGQPLPSSGVLVTNLSADLAATFNEANWYTDPNLKWSISGYESANGNVDASKVETTYGTKSTAYADPNAATVNTIESKMNGVTTEFNTGSTDGVAGFPANGYSTKGGDGAQKADPSGYASNMPGYSTFGASFEGSGFSNQALDLYSIAGSPGGSVTYSGTFTVDPNGTVSFSTSPPVVGAPEPGRAALLGLGMIGLLLRRRRSNTTAA